MSMKKISLIIAIVVVIVGAATLLFFISDGGKGGNTALKNNILYYTCGMHPDVRVSPEEYEKGKVNCPICNMKLTPVYKDTAGHAAGKKVLFYRHPMNPGITSATPAKDEMGMDYVPVYEEIETGENFYGCGMEGAEHVFSIKGVPGMKCPICGMDLIKLSKAEADKLKGVAGRVSVSGKQMELAGARTDVIVPRKLYKRIRTVGKVAYDPELAIAEEEYVSAIRALYKIRRGGISEVERRAQNLVDSAERRLKLLGLSGDQIEELGKTQKIHTSLILPEEKMWIYGEVYEYEISWLKSGQEVIITTEALPGEEFRGVVISINPVLDSKTRSLKFRAEVDNYEMKLKPDMYVDVVVNDRYGGEDSEEFLAIPKDAVLDTGTRKIVWFDEGGGRYEGREVVVGSEAVSLIEGKEYKFYPLLKGAKEGERVVTKANFLLDSQSQISGTAASAYGGSLDSGAASKGETPDGDVPAPVHQH